MNRGAVKASAATNGRFNTTGQATQINEWVDAAYEWVWDLEPWAFKFDYNKAIAVSQGASTAAIDDVREVLVVRDDLGDPLSEYRPLEFEDAFRSDLLAGVTGRADAFTVVDDGDGTKTIQFSKAQETARTYRASVERSIHHRTSGGVLTAGVWNDDTDVPAWNDGHLAIAYQAAVLGLGAENDDSSLTLMAWRDELLDGMRRAHLPDGPPLIFGSIRSQPRRRFGR